MSKLIFGNGRDKILKTLSEKVLCRINLNVYTYTYICIACGTSPLLIANMYRDDDQGK